MPPTPLRPEELFKQEKERATSAARSQHARLLAEAKVAFEKLMAEGQAARKSGRPRKHPLPPLKTGSALRPPGSPPPPDRWSTPVSSPIVSSPLPAAAAVPAAAKAPVKAVAKPKAKSKPKAKAGPKAKAKAKGKRKR